MSTAAYSLMSYSEYPLAIVLEVCKKENDFPLMANIQELSGELKNPTDRERILANDHLPPSKRMLLNRSNRRSQSCRTPTLSMTQNLYARSGRDNGKSSPKLMDEDTRGRKVRLHTPMIARDLHMPLELSPGWNYAGVTHTQSSI